MGGSATLKRIGAVVRYCRRSRNLTQYELAELIGTSYTYISALERGQRNVTIQTLERIAEACQTDVFKLLSFDTDDEKLMEHIALLMQQPQFERDKLYAVAREIFRS